jgi:hypothetical protein
MIRKGSGSPIAVAIANIRSSSLAAAEMTLTDNEWTVIFGPLRAVFVVTEARPRLW